MSGTTKITYKFDGAEMPTTAIEVTVDRSMSPRQGRAEWTRLTHKQCANCPLPVEAFSHCPVAVDLELVIDAIHTMLVTEDLHTVVQLPGGREVHRDGDAGAALGALLGLIMASSPCPVLSRLKGLAMTHVPFQSTEERIFRFISAYLLGQFVEATHGGTANWSMDGLKAILDDIATLDSCFLERLESACKENPAIESIRDLMSRATGMRDMLDSYTPLIEQYAIPAERPRA